MMNAANATEYIITAGTAGGKDSTVNVFGLA